jgi:hypothetical protein
VLDKGQLKKDLLLQLLDRFRIEADAKFETGVEIARAFAHQGPNPFLGEKQPPIRHPYNFINKPIDFCPDSAKAIQVGKLEMVSTGTFSFRHVDFGEFVPTQIKTTELMYTMLPNEVMWASLMGEKQDQLDETQFAQVTVSFCWREINYLKYVESESTVDLHVRMVLEAHMDYQKPGEAEIKDVIVSRATYDQKYTSPRNDMYTFWNPTTGYCRLYVRLWLGEGLCATGGYFEKKWEAGYKILTDKKNIEFAQYPKMTEFKNYFTDFEKRNQERAREQFNAKFNGPEGMTARRTLFLAIYMGIDPTSVTAEDLLSLLSSDSGLPDLKAITELGLRGSVRLADLEKLLKDRLTIVSDKINALAAVPDLAPRTEEIEAALARLERLKSRIRR